LGRGEKKAKEGQKETTKEEVPTGTKRGVHVGSKVHQTMLEKNSNDEVERSACRKKRVKGNFKGLALGSREG